MGLWKYEDGFTFKKNGRVSQEVLVSVPKNDFSCFR